MGDESPEQTACERAASAAGGCALPAASAAILPGIEADLGRRTGALQGPGVLQNAVAYALLGGGKRLRPLLAIHAAQAVGATPEAAFPAAAALEMVHAFSLVHDDLPAMDDDDIRRGKPTVHVKFGQAVAILAGDVLLSMAFSQLVADDVPEQLRAPLAADLAAAATAMVAGQVYDTVQGASGEDELEPGRRVRRTHEAKTGALIRAACVMGARCGGADADQLAAIDAYGNAVGLMFQVVDDLLDVEQTADAAGKRTGKDAAMGKATYPGVYGIRGARTHVQTLLQGAMDAMEPLAGPGNGGGALVDLARAMAQRTR